MLGRVQATTAVKIDRSSHGLCHSIVADKKGTKSGLFRTQYVLCAAVSRHNEDKDKLLSSLL
jgi:hypothetical protein